jgi:hypothetical protein
MVLVYLAVSFLASLAVSASVYQAFGSLMMSIVAYGATGAAILFCVLLAALLREKTDASEPGLLVTE